MDHLSDETVASGKTRLFSFPVAIPTPTHLAEVLVGIRPERIHLSHRIGDVGDDVGPLHAQARVILREDLGGEDIVYLAAEGVPLTMVDRDHYRGDDLDEQVTISIFPQHLTLFDAPTGVLIGRGALGETPVTTGAAHG